VITFTSCDAHLDLGDYQGGCIFSPRHGGPHFDGLYYWETGKPMARQEAGERAARVLGLVRRRRPRRAELVVEFIRPSPHGWLNGPRSRSPSW
jgi:hypothetical protein